MNACRCVACYSTQQYFYRDIKYCPCETMHLTRMPQIIAPIRTRPVVLKAPVTPVTIPRQIMVTDNERDRTQIVSGHGKAKLKFGIDSILGRDSIEPKRSSTEEDMGESGLLITCNSKGILENNCGRSLKKKRNKFHDNPQQRLRYKRVFYGQATGYSCTEELSNWVGLSYTDNVNKCFEISLNTFRYHRSAYIIRQINQDIVKFVFIACTNGVFNVLHTLQDASISKYKHKLTF